MADEVLQVTVVESPVLEVTVQESPVLELTIPADRIEVHHTYNDLPESQTLPDPSGGSSGQVAAVKSDLSGYELVDPASGSGDVSGPASSVSGNLATFDGVDGKLLSDSGYAPSSFATATHDHDSDYDAIGSASAVAGDLSTHEGLSTTAHGGIVASTDSRLTDARTPTAHAASHATGQSDAIAPGDIGAAPSANGVTNGDSHDHAGGDGAQIDYTGLSNLPTLGTAAALNVPATGNASTGEVVKGDDSRLTDARTPTAHKSTHAIDGSDALSANDVGADNLHGIESHGALSFNDSTKIVTIASGTNKYWYKGDSYETSDSITCDLTSTDDRDHASATLTANTLYYIYFKDATGKLYWSPTVWDLYETAPVAQVFWNGTNGALYDETHNHTRNIDWHVNAHLTIGARYYSGLDKTTPTAAAPTALSITGGTIYDEDIAVAISNPQTTARVFHQASSGIYTFVNTSLPYAGASGTPQYLDTDTYALTDVGASNFACYWVYATPDIDRPIMIIPTQAAASHNTIALARGEAPPSLAGIDISPETKLIYRWIYKGNGDFEEFVDYRLSSSLPSGFIASTSAVSVSFTPAGNIAATDVQDAIEELDAEKAALSHTHGNLTNDGKVGSTANLPLITGTDGVVQASSFGTAENTFCQGNDSRLSDSRTPTSHGNEAHSSTFITSAGVTYENLNGNSDVGTGATQVAAGNHDHSGVYEPANANLLETSDVSSTPTDGATTTPISSDWAYDHVAAADPHTGYVLESLFDANTILAATTDNTPAALTVAEQTLVGRITGGNIAALNAASVRGILGGCDMLATLTSAEVSVDGAVTLDSTAFGKMHAVECDGQDIDLPNPSGNGGKWIGFRFVTGSGSYATIARYSTETVNGRANDRAYTVGDIALYYCDGTNWTAIEQLVSIGCRVNRNGVNQTGIATITTTVIEFTTEVYDVGGGFNTSTYKYTAPCPGTYVVEIHGSLKQLDDGKFGYVGYEMFDDTDTSKGIVWLSMLWGSASPSTLTMGNTTLLKFSAGDYLKAATYHNHGSDREFIGTIGLSYMTIERYSAEV